MLEIRSATPADAAIIAEHNVRLAWESERKTLDPAITIAGVSAAIADPQGRGPYFLACVNGEIVGQCQITFEWSDWRNRWIWWLQGVYVRADHRGQRVFRALADHVVLRAREAGDVMSVRLYVERDNRAAQAIYEHLGWKTEHYEMMAREFSH